MAASIVYNNFQVCGDEGRVPTRRVRQRVKSFSWRSTEIDHVIFIFFRLTSSFYPPRHGSRYLYHRCDTRCTG